MINLPLIPSPSSLNLILRLQAHLSLSSLLQVPKARKPSPPSRTRVQHPDARAVYPPDAPLQPKQSIESLSSLPNLIPGSSKYAFSQTVIRSRAEIIAELSKYFGLVVVPGAGGVAANDGHEFPVNGSYKPEIIGQIKSAAVHLEREFDVVLRVF